MLNRRTLVCALPSLLAPGVLRPVSAFGQQAVQPGAAPSGRSRLIASVRSWGYQLQNVRVGEVARSPFDLVVIDYSRNGGASGRFTRAEVQRMQRKPDGSRRIMLGYLSIGEAEDYRYYWDDRWIETATPDGTPAPEASRPPDEGAPPQTSAQQAARSAKRGDPEVSKPDRWLSSAAPSWLGDENEMWAGNFQVKYWDEAWQRLLFGSPEAYLEQILSAGFDGIYLDRVDAFYEVADERPDAPTEMVDLVARLATQARALKPDALVFVQNGEELLARDAFLRAIDGIAKEDLLYGSPTDGAANTVAQIASSDAWLARATAAGRPVLVIEYVEKPGDIALARRELARRGFVATFGPRTLDRLVALPAEAAPGK